MRFRSTRGGAAGATFEQVISTGYAPDGGLYVPESLPKLSIDVLGKWSGLDFPSLAEAVLGMFVGDEITPTDLSAIVRGCYADFQHDEIVPVRRVGEVHVVELFHGPTFCFKDLGQQPLCRFLAHFAERRGAKRTVLVSTTGDTGPAAMRAVSDAGSKYIDIVVFYPEGQISDLQRRQMTTVSSDSARVVAFQGGGDDMDLPLKRLAGDQAFVERYGLCGINSFNFGRPVAQLVHYFWAYFRVLEDRGLALGAPVDFVIPTGAMGNIAAGYIAKNMGLPIRRLVAGVNDNDITHRTFSTGEFHRNPQMHKTLSDAINIQVPYNMERIFYYLTGGDAPLIASWMEQMDRTGRLTLPQVWLTKLQEVFGSCRVNDEAMCTALRRGLDEHGYLSDPHTAVGLAAAWGTYGSSVNEVPVAVLATASPCKFEVSVTEAVGASRWAAYASGESFPAEAHRALAARELAFLTMKAEAGKALADTQDAWERDVRGMLDAGKPTARL